MQGWHLRADRARLVLPPMQKRLVIIGAGFAGMYAALSAARLYEPRPEALTTPLLEVFEPARVTDL